uniref:hypothetical protein n=1 Tax=Burkholderia diffusa TaxID=488732 RepID=UPI001CC3B465|nr:hypothetical protein [Burkholderia diffusa]
MDQVIALLNRTAPGSQVEPLGTGWIVADWVDQLYYYFFGVVVWVILGALAFGISQAMARIVLVGFKQFWAEEMAMWAEDARRARIEAARERRRELRRKLTEPKSSAGMAILIGTLFGFFVLFLSR